MPLTEFDRELLNDAGPLEWVRWRATLLVGATLRCVGGVVMDAAWRSGRRGRWQGSIWGAGCALDTAGHNIEWDAYTCVSRRVK
jgi:hypothetical protein